MKLIVGLGNPGSRYEITRHNIGFMVVDLLADKLNIDFRKKSHFSEMAEGRLGGEKIILLKPLTYMNLSGQAVSSAMSFYKIEFSNLLVVFDDMDLDIGRLRIRPNGSAGGHKGMGSIIRMLGSEELPRLRVGIGHPEYQPVTDFVLRPFSDDEWAEEKKAITNAADAILLWIEEGIITAMNKYNSSGKAE
ncbi:MAG: aminoacyl-tRNA hydrolase [Desulfitobacteriaceae bacterium]|nr:aminoacyl-tRNA hydrolase [Desulfitobacteriaceae bacterium]MDD4752291.1 aminoacyl-tRNA hydrolase [Desulfitobacteriaceae bacterium]